MRRSFVFKFTQEKTMGIRVFKHKFCICVCVCPWVCVCECECGYGSFSAIGAHWLMNYNHRDTEEWGREF